MYTQKNITIAAILVFLLVIVGLLIGFRSFTKDTKNNPVRGSGEGNPIFFDGGIGGTFNDADLGTTTPNGEVIIPTLRRISLNPTSGATIFDTKNKTRIRYVERATGHIFETSTTTLTQQRVGNVTIPRIQRGVFVDGGDGVILQYLTEDEIIKSFYEPIPKEGEGADGVFLRNNITHISTNKAGNQIFSLTSDGSGYLSNPDGSKESRVFISPITEWLGQWVGATIFLSTKPSNNVEGFLFKLNTKTGSITKQFSLKGLVAIQNEDASQTFFSKSDNTATTLFVYNDSEETLVELPLKTLVDKCVWAGKTKVYCGTPYENPQATYPDAWYQGNASFSDDLWVFDTETNIATLVYDLEAEGRRFDMTNLMINESGNTIIFTDKKSLMLWSIAL